MLQTGRRYSHIENEPESYKDYLKRFKDRAINSTKDSIGRINQSSLKDDDKISILAEMVKLYIIKNK